ncbi:D-sedoheptulose-7-phosphate isomerase [Microlunatus soli]|uniref:Phosphoheptose isomerase n=1 Tax=Microlunatus soli TaxID=630515 RepID=A0A1H1W9A3_9ACTN|nr:SIS domain-containing protein [Microlunatus soli]SDS93220.1 phosphoheptose isomerase [Microlunatus soli]
MSEHPVLNAPAPLPAALTVPGWARDQLTDYIDAGRAVQPLLPDVLSVGRLLCDRFAAGRSVWTFGNGGSAADAQHLSGELIGHYRRDRRPLPCLTLGTDAVVLTCTANDYAFDDVFARQVTAVVRPGDVVCAFSTSGRSTNVLEGLRAAGAARATTVLFGGGDGGPAADLADHVLLSPETATARIQEVHTLMIHLISEQVDAWAAGEQLPS